MSAICLLRHKLFPFLLWCSDIDSVSFFMYSTQKSAEAFILFQQPQFHIVFLRQSLTCENSPESTHSLCLLDLYFLHRHGLLFLNTYSTSSKSIYHLAIQYKEARNSKIQDRNDTGAYKSTQRITVEQIKLEKMLFHVLYTQKQQKNVRNTSILQSSPAQWSWIKVFKLSFKEKLKLHINTLYIKLLVWLKPSWTAFVSSLTPVTQFVSRDASHVFTRQTQVWLTIISLSTNPFRCFTV